MENIVDFFKEWLIEPFQDSWILGILFWLISIAVTGLVLWFFIWLIDSSFLDEKKGIGKICNKRFEPAHYVTTYVQSGKVFLPITSFIDDQFILYISVNGVSDDVGVYQDFYNKSSIGENLNVSYTEGRILSSIYIKEIN